VCVAKTDREEDRDRDRDRDRSLVLPNYDYEKRQVRERPRGYHKSRIENAVEDVSERQGVDVVVPNEKKWWEHCIYIEDGLHQVFREDFFIKSVCGAGI
jgi:hypothetical protein